MSFAANAPVVERGQRVGAGKMTVAGNRAAMAGDSKTVADGV
jgi:hypothetical protein